MSDAKTINTPTIVIARRVAPRQSMASGRMDCRAALAVTAFVTVFAFAFAFVKGRP